MIIAIVLSAILIAICTALHFGALRFASQFVTPSRHPGQCLAVAVAAIVIAHTAEALLYAAGFLLITASGTFVLQIMGGRKPFAS